MKRVDQYWVDRALALEADLHRETEVTFDRLDSLILQALEIVTQLINEWYGRYMPDNKGSYRDAKKRLSESELQTLKRRVSRYLDEVAGFENEKINRLLKELDRLNKRTYITRLEALQTELKAVSHALHINEAQLIEAFVKNQYSQGYYRTYFDVFQKLGFGFSLETLNDTDIQSLLNEPWAPDKLTFYERILRNDSIFLNESQKTIVKHIHLGSSPNKVISELSKEMGRSRRSVGAMVASESAFFSNEARADCMKALGTERYRIVATLDMKTSDICREMDGKDYAMKDYLAGATAPPFHVRCRSTTAPYYSDMDIFAERIARGAAGETYYVPANMTYKAWYDQYIKD